MTGCAQATALTRQLLGFTRRGPLHPQTMSLFTAAEEAVALLRRLFDPRIELRVEGKPDAWPGPMSTVDQCIREACPMAIGLQGPLPFGAERRFAQYLYPAIADGQRVGEAVRLARTLYAGDHPETATCLNELAARVQSSGCHLPCTLDTVARGERGPVYIGLMPMESVPIANAPHAPASASTIVDAAACRCVRCTGTRPRSGVYNRCTSLVSVLLPEPERPTMPITSPGLMSRSMPLTA